MKRKFITAACVLAAAAFTACGSSTANNAPETGMPDPDAPVVTEAETEAVSEENVEPSAEQSIAGTYKQTIHDEMGGEKVEFTYFVKLNKDNTGVMSLQDEIPIIWDNSKITYKDDPNTSYDYTIENNKLTIDMNGIPSEFIKE